MVIHDPQYFPQFPEPPESRTYVHDACGQGTTVDGWILDALSNPYRGVSGTMCAHCDQGVPLKRVAWAETGESIADYRKRMKQLVPASFRRRRWLVAAACVAGGLLLGVAGSYPFWTPRDVLPAVVGGAVGLVAGLALTIVAAPMPKIEYRAYV
jgi:hypothetical protein